MEKNDALVKMQHDVRELKETVNALKSLFLMSDRHTIKSFKRIDDNFEVVKKDLEDLKRDSDKSFDEVGNKLDDLHTEVMKIQKVSNYSEEYENLITLLGKT